MIMFLIGFFSGIITGMGVGGGTLLIPALAIFSDLSQQQIQGVNLVVFIPASIAALIIHKKKGNIDSSKSKPLIIFGIIGAIAGAFLAIYLDSDILRKVFAAFLLIIGIIEIKKKPVKKGSS